MRTTVSLDKIRLDGGTQPRVAIDESLIAEYAEVVEQLPPITVYFDGADYWLADGFHRLHAMRQRGVVEADCEVRKGTRRDAVLASVGANAQHGKRRTNEDKRRAVETLLEDATWGAMSDREIAKLCAVSHPFVASLRPRRSFESGNVTTPEPKPVAVKDEPEVETKPKVAIAPPPEVKPLTPYELAVKNADKIEDLISAVKQINTLAAALAENKHVGQFFRHQQFAEAMSNALRVLKFALPKSPCPYTPNCVRGTCKCCKGAGWIPAEIHKALSKAEREMLGDEA